MQRTLCSLALGCAVAAALHAQTPPMNVRLLSQVNPVPGAGPNTNNYAGIWGMVVAGREIAILPARTGTYIYDCTDPRNPVQTGFFAGPGSSSQPYFWREATGWRNHAYIGSEHGSCQVIDVSNPAAPALIRTIGTMFHTVSVDQGAGLLYGNGGGARGCRIYDLNVSATNPPQINAWTSPYVHDCLPIRGFAYLAQINSGTFRIINVTDPRNVVTLSSTPTPSGGTHNVWVSDDDQIAVTADEIGTPPYCLTVFDISNKAAPAQLATWCSPFNATVHNVFIKGRVAHFSCYTDGYWAVDISNPASPTPIAHFDTTALSGSNYQGCWGCYPFQPSGVIYLSDMQNGFYIVEPTCGVPLHYGQGVAGTGGIVPTIDYDGGFARVGNSTFAIEGQNLRGGTSTALLLATGRGMFPILGVTVLVDPLMIVTSPTFGTTGTPGAPGAGTLSAALGIPGDPTLAGTTWNAQIIAIDPSGPAGLASTRGFEFTICP
jgi:choice-of-anchor B domain-containing protein